MQLMIGPDLRSRLHLLRPDLRGCVLKHQAIQVNSRASAPERNFEAGDSVMVRNYQPNHSRWQPGCIQRRVGTKSYHVEVPGGSMACLG